MLKSGKLRTAKTSNTEVVIDAISIFIKINYHLPNYGEILNLQRHSFPSEEYCVTATLGLSRMPKIGHVWLILFLQSEFTEGIIFFSGDERPYVITNINTWSNFTRNNFFEIVFYGEPTLKAQNGLYWSTNYKMITKAKNYQNTKMMIKKKLLFLLLTLTGGLYGVTKSNLSDDFSQLPPPPKLNSNSWTLNMDQLPLYLQIC